MVPTLLPWITLMVGDPVVQQPLPVEPPATVIAISWVIVVAESMIIAVLWNRLNKEEQRLDEERARINELTAALKESVRTTVGVRKAIESLDERLSVHDDIRELLRRTED